MADRPAIPRDLRRQVLLEAGHRCAIPTCRFPTTEVHHIEAWSKVKEHRFENLIALCPNCHGRAGRGEIDTPSVRQYKANLSVMTGRYGTLERRILEMFAEDRSKNEIEIQTWDVLQISYLIKDGILAQLQEKRREVRISFGLRGIQASGVRFILTDKGRAFIDRWVQAQELD